MRICHIVYECTPGRFAGGVQKAVYELALAQVERGHSVEVWTVGVRSIDNGDGPLLIRSFSGVPALGSPALNSALIAEHSRFDIIHSHNTFLSLNRYAAGIARRKGARVFYHAHGAIDPCLLRGWSLKALKKRLYLAGFERRNYSVARGLIGLTSVECAQFASMRVTTPIYEVGNGITVQPPATSFGATAFRLQHRIKVDCPVILFIGRINEKKGIHYLIEALPAVLARLPTAQLVICGSRNQDIAYVRRLDARIADLNLAASVRWVGFVDEIQKRAALDYGSVFAHPSYSEGMALAVLEAMSAGIPTVVTPGCYMDSAVAAGALQMTSQDAVQLAASLVDLLSDPKAAEGLAMTGRSYVRATHTWEAVAERLTRIYKEDGSVEPYRAVGAI